MLKRMVGVCLVGVGLVSAGLAQDAPAKPTKEQRAEARKKLNTARAKVDKLARETAKKDKELAAAMTKRDEARQAMNTATREVLLGIPEAKPLVEQDDKLLEETKGLTKEMAARRKAKKPSTDLLQKRKDLMAKRQALGKKMATYRRKASRHESVVPLRKTFTEADRNVMKLVRAKLGATEEGKQALADFDEADKAVRAMTPKRSRGKAKSKSKSKRKAKAAEAE